MLAPFLIRRVVVADFCYLLLTNGIMASFIAMGVWGTSKWVRHTALMHLLWVLVLLRMLAPPMVPVDLSAPKQWLANAAQRNLEQSREDVESDSFSVGPRVVNAIVKALQAPSVTPRKHFYPEDTVASEVAYSKAATPGEVVAEFAYYATWSGKALVEFFNQALGFLFPVWLFGTIGCLYVQLRSATCFWVNMQKHSYSTRVWQRRAERVASRMGLRSCPQLLLVRASISPMLWGFGRNTRILFPEKLLTSLSVNAQDTLIAHELAHYRRGDQWVRLIELVATAFFWWHPVLWWARSEIEKVEEHSCDAWAVQQANGNRRTYAEALLAAIDFVSVSQLPPAASGATSVNFLRQRIRAIMQQRLVSDRSLMPDSYPSVLVLAVLLLVPCPALLGPGSTTPTVALPATAVATKTQTPKFGTRPKTERASEDETSNSLTIRESDTHLHFEIDSKRHAVFTNLGNDVRRDFGVGRVAVFSFSNDQRWLAVGTLDGKVEILDTESGKTHHGFTLGHAAISTICFAPEDAALAIGTRNGVCRLYGMNGDTEEEIKRKRIGGVVNDAQFSPDGRYVTVKWTRRSDEVVEVWDLFSGRLSTKESSH